MTGAWPHCEWCNGFQLRLAFCDRGKSKEEEEEEEEEEEGLTQIPPA